MEYAVKGKIINPVSKYGCDYFEKGILHIKNGRLKKINPPLNTLKNVKIIDFSDKFIMPGFIDTHLHIPQIDSRAMYGESLLDWLEKYIYPAEAKFKDEKIAEDVSNRFFDEALKNGTTALSAYSTHHFKSTDIAFKTAQKKGIKAFIGKTMMDYSSSKVKAPETLKESVDKTRALIKKWDGSDKGRLRYVLTPRFAPACTKELLQETSKISKEYNLNIQTHLSENEGEVVAVLRRFKECRTYTEVYSKYGILTSRTILAHCIHLYESEFAEIEKAKSKISHCPSSNFFLKSGKFRMHEAEKYNITMALGSDIGAGPSFSMLDVAKASNYAQPFQFPPEKAYYLSTLGGAECLGIEKETGNFKEGKDADYIVVDIKNIYPEFKFAGISNTLAFMIYLGNDKMIDKVYVRGKQIYERQRCD